MRYEDMDITAYDFVQLGERLADTLTRAAEEQVNRAQQILDQTKSMADIIRTQVAKQAQQIEEMNGRFRAFGEQMLDAHRLLNGDTPVQHKQPTDRDRNESVTQQLGYEPSTAGIDEQLRALANVRLSRDAKAARPAIHPDDPRLRDEHDRRRHESADGRVELPREVDTGEPRATRLARSRHAADPEAGPVGDNRDR